MKNVLASCVHRVGMLIVLVVCASGAGRAQVCTPDWQPGFSSFTPIDKAVTAVHAFDDGSGPVLVYTDTEFNYSPGPGEDYCSFRLSRLDAPGPFLLDWGFGTIQAMETFDDGNGPRLYVGGDFTGPFSFDGALAVWDGAALVQVDGPNSGVFDLATFDDGGGEALYAIGFFNQPGLRIARWDGTAWSDVGGGIGSLGDMGRALVVHDDGSGEKLYAAGNFDVVGGSLPANDIARWDGTSWMPLAGGTPDSSQEILVMASFDDGSGAGAQLYAGGTFTSIDGVAASQIARWDGSAWHALGNGLSVGATSKVTTLTVHDDGSGPALYVGGKFGFVPGTGLAVSNVARWDGTSWSAVDEGTNLLVTALVSHDDGTSSGLFAGGYFTEAGGIDAPYLAQLREGHWSNPTLSYGFDDSVHALTTHDEGLGDGEQLFVAGSMNQAGNADDVGLIVSWADGGWQKLGQGLDIDGQLPPAARVSALCSFDGIMSGSLYAGGTFTHADGQPVNRVARWDGANWSALGGGITGGTEVMSLAGFDDGGGALLYAGGSFGIAGGLPVANIARWDGAVWSAVGGLANGNVRALTVHDDGGGERLIAGGAFTLVGGVACNRIAMWDGSNWATLGSGLDGTVRAFAEFDDGSGMALYAGGDFTTAGGVAADRVARWDGASWTAVGAGMNSSVRTLSVFDDGSGPALYAGGSFTVAGGQPASRIARWDGVSWTALGDGVDATVHALQPFDRGDGSQLHVGGSFTNVGSFLGAWGCGPTPWADLGGGTTGVAGAPSLKMSGDLTPSSSVTLDLMDGAPSALAIIFVSFTSSPASFLGGTLHAFPVDELVVLGTDGAGEIHGAASFPGGPPGAGLWFQVGIEDGSVPLFGASLSNGVMGVVP